MCKILIIKIKSYLTPALETVGGTQVFSALDLSFSFNVAMGKDKCDFKMAHYNHNKKTVSSLKPRNHQIELEEDPINVIYGILDQIFRALDEEKISAKKQLIPYLATPSK